MGTSPLSGYLPVGLLFFLLFLLAIAAPASDWRPIQETHDGIRIYRKDATESGLIEFRGAGYIEAPLPLVASVIFDAERRRQWIKGMADARILRWEGNESFIEYDHIDMPTFFTDRDFVSRVRISTDQGKREVIFQFRAADDAAAPVPDRLRGEVINMTFRLQAMDHDRRTKVDAEFLCDPKGWIPAWLVNYFLKDWPTTTFRNLREEVKRPGTVIEPRFASLLVPEAGSRRGEGEGKRIHPPPDE